MANLKGKVLGCGYMNAVVAQLPIWVQIDDKLEKLAEAKKELKELKKEMKSSKSSKTEAALEKKKAAVKRVEDQLRKLEVAQTDKEENKTIALGTSKLNYLDPRISVAWCKKHGVPVEKVYNKTQRDKFNWAIDMADETFVF
jgi:DNA topoisomerase-1